MTNEPPDNRVRALIATIQAAFPAGAERPARDALVSHRCCECAEVAEFFAWAERYGNPAAEIHEHSNGIGLLSGGAFVYWLPAFMIAQLEESDMDYVASALRDRLSFQEWLGLQVFTRRQCEVIVEFLLECSRRYDEPLGEDEDEDNSTFRSTVEEVRRWEVVERAIRRL